MYLLGGVAALTAAHHAVPCRGYSVKQLTLRMLASRAPPEVDWFADGLRFSCTACGNCCTGNPGHVYFSAAEGRAIATRLSLAEDEFYRRNVRRIAPEGAGPDGPFVITLMEKDAPDGKGRDCILLDRSTGRALCSVYEARPAQCRSWPFWSGNVESPEAWEEAKADTPCPGMGVGPLVPAAEVARLASRDEEDEERMFDAAIDGTSEVEAVWRRAHNQNEKNSPEPERQ